MSTTPARDALPVTCPRCNGKGAIPHFAHVEDGRCFLCEGAGHVAAERVAAYVTSTGTPDRRPRKRVDLEGFGPAVVYRCAAGDLAAFEVEIPTETASVSAWFDVVVEGGVRLIRVVEVTDGLRNRRDALTRALRAALR